MPRLAARGRRDPARRTPAPAVARAAEGRPVVRVGLKVRYAPFFTKTHAKKIPETFDRNEILARALDLACAIEAGRPIRLLGLRAEMTMPDDARKGHTPTRGGW